MTGPEIAALRKRLGCGVRDLALAIGAEPNDLVAWESGERFPTKRHVDQLQALGERGPGAVPTRRRSPAPPSGDAAGALDRLEDPRLAKVLRRLCEDPELFAEVVALVERRRDGAT
ncbi:MAG: hypothetical protein IT376_21325 [Polyangiaceae bacterium]|nr:hypothetical protein [Polyangiaceae bacterium]